VRRSSVGVRLGVDIGGTFTDVVLVDESTGDTRIGKVPSTPRDPAEGFLTAVDRMVTAVVDLPASLRLVAHATTVATNAIIEGKTARTAFITTEGFRDLLEIGRQIRPSLYDLRFEKPRPLVPRYLAFAIRERLDAAGQVLVALDVDQVRRVVDKLRDEAVESVAICLLHSYVNATHENTIAAMIHAALPSVSISLSSAIVPEIREYERASTVVINASIQPVVQRYLGRIEAQLRERGVAGELLVMQSGGGMMTFRGAGEQPVFMVESGPAAGVIATQDLGNLIGLPDAISFDMGGTTAKVGLVRSGAVQVTKEYQVGAVARPGGSARGSGYPIRTPVVELVEIGAGGGSIAWVDSGGALRVGPESAGADPGPAAYARGGKDPTVTDANLILGRLDSSSFLGGEMALDVEAARNAIKERCADRLGLDVITTAYGIVEIANAAMIRALRSITVQRGLDPRGFTMVCFGGAGPMHMSRLASELGVGQAVVPVSPGTFSARGLVLSDLRHELSASFHARADNVDFKALRDLVRALRRQGRASLSREGVAPETMVFQHHIELRYVGQSHELTIPTREDDLDATGFQRAISAFHKAHDEAYGFSAPSEPVEIFNVQISAVGAIPKIRVRELPDQTSTLAPRSSRPVYFEEAGGYVDVPVFNRYDISSQGFLMGPCIVEELDSTTVVHPGNSIRIDRWANLIVQIGTPNRR
jgi:N-methylhydantoinase A